MSSDLVPVRRFLRRGMATILTLLVMSAWFGSGRALEESNVSGTKEAGDTDISCGESTTVMLSLTGEAQMVAHPTDIVLVLDRSASQDPTLTTLKAIAKNLVDEIDLQSDGMLDGVIGGGSRVGIVRFAGTAALSQGLTTNVALLKSAIDALPLAGGLTNHHAAITFAQTTLTASNPTSAKVMILLTDGETTVGFDPNLAATAAKNAGTVILGIAIGDEIVLTGFSQWVSPPASTNLQVYPDLDLEALVQSIGLFVASPAATDIAVTDTVNSRFTVGNVSATKGTVVQIGNVLTWNIANLGSETVTLTYTITHDPSQSGGDILVNDSVTYMDAQGQTVTFQSVVVRVHGCPANLTLTPAMDENTVGTTHTLIAVVTDDFGDPVGGITVNFSVMGSPSVVTGFPSAPFPSSGSAVTDASGEAFFSYTNTSASSDVITASASIQTNEPSSLVASAAKTWQPLPALIDVKPGSDPNSFGARSRGSIPVALLGSPTFIVTAVNDETVLFGDAPSPLGDAVPTGAGRLEDVNDDGFLDKVYHFAFTETHLEPEDTFACLGGKINELDFLGCDTVRIVPQN